MFFVTSPFITYNYNTLNTNTTNTHYRITLTFKALLVTKCTNKLHILTIVRSTQSVFMCYVFISEQTATCAIYSIN
jgi:hypothetical protein